MQTLSSVQNSTLQHVVRLLERSRLRRESGQFVLEGLHLCQSFLSAGGEILALLVRADAQAHAEVLALQAQLAVPFYLLTDGALKKITSLSSAPEVLALACRDSILLKDEHFDVQTDAVFLENIQDPGNLGTILRIAAASGKQQVLLSRQCVDIWSPKVLRAGMGAHFHLKIFENRELVPLLAQFAGQKLALALCPDAVDFYDQDLRQPTAFLFGNEGAGLSAELRSAARAVKIPMAAAESLNVAACAAVCLFESVRQRR